MQPALTPDRLMCSWLSLTKSPGSVLSWEPAPDVSTTPLLDRPRGLRKLAGRGVGTFNFSPVPPRRPKSGFGVGGPVGLGVSGLNSSLGASMLLNASHESLSGRLSAAPPTSNKALVSFDDDGTVLIVNRTASAMFGRDPSEMVGANIATLISRNSLGAVGDVAALLVRGDNNGDDEMASGKVVEARASDGATFPVSLWFVPPYRSSIYTRNLYHAHDQDPSLHSIGFGGGTILRKFDSQRSWKWSTGLR